MADNNTKPIQKYLSPMRKLYIFRLIARCIVFIFCVVLYFRFPEQFDVLHGMNFFKKFSVLHILWVVWVIDMMIQLIPSGAKVSIGSLKLFKRYFKKSDKEYDKEALKKYYKPLNIRATVIFLIWVVLISAIGILNKTGLLHEAEMFMVSALFYVFDVICVVIWCPFRLILNTRCCTTCRIFNWDHLMMYTPMLFIAGFYSVSLIVLATAVFLLWELYLLLYPERFWEVTNCSLRCKNCSDKLCPPLTIGKIKKYISKK